MGFLALIALLAALAILTAPAVREWIGRFTTARRLVFFALALALSLVAVSVLSRLDVRTDYLTLLAPVMTGSLTGLLLLVPSPRSWSLKKVIVAAPFAAMLIALFAFAATTGDPFLMRFAPLTGGVVAFTWRLGDWRGTRRLEILALLILALSVANAYAPSTVRARFPADIQTLYDVAWLAWMEAAIVTTARLVQAALASMRSKRQLAAIARLALAILLLLAFYDQNVTMTAWDFVTDGLGGVVLVIFTFIVGLVAIGLLVWTSPDGGRLAASVFGVLLLLATFGPTIAWSSPTAITEARAEAINRAIVLYYAHNGRFPDSLGALVPWYVWHIPEPIMFRELTWCYEGGDDYYRLGYVHRRAFGDRATVRIHVSAGEPPNPTWACDQDATWAGAKYHY